MFFTLTLPFPAPSKGVDVNMSISKSYPISLIIVAMEVFSKSTSNTCFFLSITLKKKLDRLLLIGLL